MLCLIKVKGHKLNIPPGIPEDESFLTWNCFVTRFVHRDSILRWERRWLNFTLSSLSEHCFGFLNSLINCWYQQKSRQIMDLEIKTKKRFGEFNRRFFHNKLTQVQLEFSDKLKVSAGMFYPPTKKNSSIRIALNRPMLMMRNDEEVNATLLVRNASSRSLTNW